MVDWYLPIWLHNIFKWHILFQPNQGSVITSHGAFVRWTTLDKGLPSIEFLRILNTVFHSIYKRKEEMTSGFTGNLLWWKRVWTDRQATEDWCPVLFLLGLYSRRRTISVAANIQSMTVKSLLKSDSYLIFRRWYCTHPVLKSSCEFWNISIPLCFAGGCAVQPKMNLGN